MTILMNCFQNNFKKLLKLFFCVLPASPVYSQLHQITVNDTAYIQSNYLEDSTQYFSFRTDKKLNGSWIVYYDESKRNKALESNFEKLTRTEKRWYDDGKLLSERKCEHDTCTTDYYYRSGTLMKRDIEAVSTKGINRFYSVSYCDNGQIKYSPPLNPDSRSHQFISTFYCSGRKKEELTFLIISGKQFYIGPYTEWYENGQIKTQGNYDDTNPGQKTGFWNYYKEDGKFTLQERYENGRVVDHLDY